MNTVLIDTDVVSFLFKGDSRANEYAPFLKNRRLALSFMTVAELFQWAEIRNWGDSKISGLEKSLENYIVLPADIHTCRLWAEVRAYRRSVGRPVSAQDAWIAAAALRYQIPLITHNAKDFEKIEKLKIITRVS
ncbi:MAG: twitching motility protein PilT [Desulfobacteraceae bacterium IS3]|nr:MAG: twitching motility protein PilT [Desulfobacteraceae bacterium IS3]